MGTAVSTNIRPFHVDISDRALDDLRRRIAATQWPEKETVDDDSQGVPLALIQELARYWATAATGCSGCASTTVPAHGAECRLPESR